MIRTQSGSWSRLYLGVLTAGTIAIFLFLWLALPDTRTHDMRMRYAANLSGMVFIIHSSDETDANKLTALRKQWTDHHRELNELFADYRQDLDLDQHFKALNNAFFALDDDLSKPQLVGSTERSELQQKYSSAADRIFIWENDLFESKMLNFKLMFWGAGLALIVFAGVFFRVIVVRNQHALKAEAEQRIQELNLVSGDFDALKAFVFNVFRAFERQLTIVTNAGHDESRSANHELLKLTRSARSAGAYAGALAGKESADPVPFSFEGLITDVIDFIRTESEFSQSALTYTLQPGVSSAIGMPNLIGSLVSQTCISIMGYRGVQGLNIETSAIESDEDVVQLNLAFRVLAPSDHYPALQGYISGLLDRETRLNDFGSAIVGGLLGMLGGKQWQSIDPHGLPVFNLSVVCHRYADVVSSDDNSELKGKRIFVLDTDIEKLRVVVRQLSGYGIQATPFNSALPVIEEPGSVRKFDAGIIVCRDLGDHVSALHKAIRGITGADALQLIALYPDETKMTGGLTWDAVLSGSPTEAELVAALRFCLPDQLSSSAEPRGGITLPAQPTALQRARH